MSTIDDGAVAVDVHHYRKMVRMRVLNLPRPYRVTVEMSPNQARETANALMHAAALADGMDISGAKLNGVSKKPKTRPDEDDGKIAWENFQHDLGGDMSGTPPEADR